MKTKLFFASLILSISGIISYVVINHNISAVSLMTQNNGNVNDYILIIILIEVIFVLFSYLFEFLQMKGNKKVIMAVMFFLSIAPATTWNTQSIREELKKGGIKESSVVKDYRDLLSDTKNQIEDNKKQIGILINKNYITKSNAIREENKILLTKKEELIKIIQVESKRGTSTKTWADWFYDFVMLVWGTIVIGFLQFINGKISLSASDMVQVLIKDFKDLREQRREELRQEAEQKKRKRRPNKPKRSKQEKQDAKPQINQGILGSEDPTVINETKEVEEVNSSSDALEEPVIENAVNLQQRETIENEINEFLELVAEEVLDDDVEIDNELKSLKLNRKKAELEDPDEIIKELLEK